MAIRLDVGSRTASLVNEYAAATPKLAAKNEARDKKPWRQAY
jgi:hypothetical protein